MDSETISRGYAEGDIVRTKNKITSRKTLDPVFNYSKPDQ